MAVIDASQADFAQKVLARSSEVPVVVDFWAEWCGPCRQLGPALENEARAREGDVDLVKVDVDSNQQLAAEFGVQGIPAVKAFRDGKVAADFTGAIPPAQVKKFFDSLVPSEADRLAAKGDEENLRAALASDPRHADASKALARILLARGETAEAAELTRPFAGDFEAEGLAARAELTGANGEAGDLAQHLTDGFEAWDENDPERALEAFQQAVVATEDSDARDLIRRVMVAIFTELGAGHPLAREHRRRLAAAL